MPSASPTRPRWITRSTDRRAARVAGSLLFIVALGCGDGRDVGTGGSGGNESPREVAEVRIESEPLVGTRIGQRWALTAVVLDALGEPIADLEVDWGSSDSAVANVSAEGLLTAIAAGETQITATVGAHSDSVELTSHSAVPSDVGEMVTTWFARSDDAAVAIVEGRLEVFTVYPGAAEPTSPWPHPGVERFQWEGDRLAILTDVVDGLGTLRVLDRHEEWTVLRVGDAISFQLEGNQIAELGAGGSLRVREGLHGAWTTLATSGVEQFEVHGDRISIVDEDGVFRVKDGMDAEWVELATGVRAFELHGERIAVLLDEGDGRLQVKDGLDGPWTTLEERVITVALSGNRIGVLRKDGVARVKDGLDGEWTLLANSYVEDLQLAGDRVAIQFEGGDLRVRDGVEGPWTVFSTRSSRFVLQEDYIGWVTEEGELWFTIGLDGPSWNVTPTGDVSQVLPVADVPVPPARTTAAEYSGPLGPCAGSSGDSWHCPTRYAEAQQACVDDGSRCQSIAELSSSVPAYGRFCGSGRPTDLDRDWANGPDGGPIDAFDALCMHHDHAADWYPESGNGALDACIVRYGLSSARVTRDGTVIASGTAAYDEIMSKMENLRDAMTRDDGYVEGCSADQLDAFIEATRARH